jgi:hypothetical protein
MPVRLSCLGDNFGTEGHPVSIYFPHNFITSPLPEYLTIVPNPTKRFLKMKETKEQGKSLEKI